ncbi:MAG: PQQ-binding-like beta-propeller repeat protein [Pirellulales bacterium]|nr:PQQ-binding-like beta-propeller repeat protein [Pirellulales bacterium]
MQIDRQVYHAGLFCSLLLLCAPWLAYGDNWPQFRGPDNQGHATSTTAPLKWSAKDNIAWKTAIPGEGWSSPIVWEDRVFVTTAADGGKSCRLLALDRKSGEILWNKEVFTQELLRKEGRNTYATPTPATDGQRVYACFGDGSFAAVDFQGEIVWTNRDYKFYSQHGLGTSPILHEGLLIMPRDGSSEGEDKKVGWQTPWDGAYIIALDAATGREKWKAARGQSRISHGAPCLWKSPAGTQLISEAGDVVQGFDLKTGKRLWSSEVIGEGKVPSTIIGAGLVFTAGGWGGKETIKAFKLGGMGELKEQNLVWEQAKGMPKVPSMIFVAPYLYAMTDEGVASCFDEQTGKIVWQKRIGGNFSASPVAVGDRLYFVGDEGETVVLAAKKEFAELARNPLGEKVQASPAVAHGQLFIRTEGHLFCIGQLK